MPDADPEASQMRPADSPAVTARVNLVSTVGSPF